MAGRQRNARTCSSLIANLIGQAAFYYPELPPPIWRGLRRLGSKRRVQQIADGPNP